MPTAADTPDTVAGTADPAGLSGKTRRHLRGLGHHLSAIVLVGKDGLTPALVEATAQALSDHELIKVKLGENATGDRHELADDLALRTQSELIGLIGRTFLLFRANPKKPKLALPAAKRPAGAKTVRGAAPRERAARPAARPSARPARPRR